MTWGASVRVTVFDAKIAGIAHGPQFRAFKLQVGNRVLNNSRARVPVDTGNLRSSGTVEERGDVVRVRYRANYAIFVHDGTRHMRGRPFLTDALREEIGRL